MDIDKGPSHGFEIFLKGCAINLLAAVCWIPLTFILWRLIGESGTLIAMPLVAVVSLIVINRFWSK
jgi:hypothetical protein